jgi:hypothetical protein
VGTGDAAEITTASPRTKENAMPRDPSYGQPTVSPRDVELWQTVLTDVAVTDGSHLPLMMSMLQQAINDIWFQHRPELCELAEDCYICDAVRHAAVLLAAHDNIVATNQATA